MTAVALPMVVSLGLGIARTPLWTIAIVPAWWAIRFLPALSDATTENDRVQLAVFLGAYVAASVVLWVIGRALLLRATSRRRRGQVVGD